MKAKWYETSGDYGDIVISTRIRLARNLAEYPFPERMSASQRRECENKIKETVLNNGAGISKRFKYLELGLLPQAQVVSLVERHLISPEFAKDNDAKLLLLDDESVSVMINEEDHIRLQVMRSGLDPDGAFELADKLDTLLDEQLHFAFDDNLGYLTACPTNLGTGMRASVMLHLPALQENGSIAQLSSTISKLGLAIRGIYGEGSRPLGAIYQISNQVTLGISEKAAIANLRGIAVQLIAQEKSLREKMVLDERTVDSIWRSYGILTNARMISSDEFMQLISNVRLGVSAGLIDSVSMDTINRLTVNAQAGMISMHEGRDMTAAERDKARAEMIRTALAS
ncbi:MAG: protein arginine kinase [Clostridia bacterium]|nr:protein arginine kinase [Clostridia bacterium]